MDDLLSPLFAIPILIVVAEILAMICLSRMQVRRRLAWIVGTYLLFVALAVSVGLIERDEFGFSWIPLLVITEPWTIVIAKLWVDGGFLLSNSFVPMIVGAAFNCVIFYSVDRLSYPRISAKFSPPQAT